MPKKSEFVLKDSPPEVIAANPGVEPKGRSYDANIARERPGAAKIDEILLGTKLACVAVTDDEADTLKKVSKMNPWHEVALTTIAGSVEEAHKPLKHILFKHFGLGLDHHIDVSKMAGFVHSVDVQGYIAHNDDTIVVSFRCTTSALDWMSNFSIASSEWELEEDVAQGHSGVCSCLDGQLGNWLCFGSGNEKKPRVHTGFYNSVLQVIPLFQEHVDPLLRQTEKPRTLYVVGHSLGGGVSTLAAAYFLLSYDWEDLPHRLLNVSAGTPRSCKKSMAAVIDGELASLGPKGKANFFRVVMDQDSVCRVPFERTGYAHVGRMIYLTEDGEVLVNPRQSPDGESPKKSRSGFFGKKDDGKEGASLAASKTEETEETTGEEEGAKKEENGGGGIDMKKYSKTVSKIPKPFRDHCPDCYLEPLVALYERENTSGD